MSLANTKPKAIIYGIGAMAKTYASYLALEYDIIAFTVEQKLRTAEQFNGLPLVPFEQLQQHYPPAQHQLIIAVGYSQMNEVRARLSAAAKDQGFSLIRYVDPSIRLHNGVNIGENTVLFEHSSVHCDSQIGNNVFISSGVHIGHDCVIGDNVWINSGVTLGGGVTIANNSFIGMNATISHGVTIAKKSFIGAATLVNKDSQEQQVIIAPAGEAIAMNSEVFLRFSKVMNND